MNRTICTSESFPPRDTKLIYRDTRIIILAGNGYYLWQFRDSGNKNRTYYIVQLQDIMDYVRSRDLKYLDEYYLHEY